MENLDEYRRDIKKEVLSQTDLSRDLSDQEIMDLIDNAVLKIGKRRYISLGDKCKLKKEIFNSIRRLDILQELLEEEDITEIMVNGHQNIFIEKAGTLLKWDRHFESREKLADIVQQIASKSNRIVNEASPIVDARLEDGSRVNIVLPPVSLEGPVITIRKFPKNRITMEELICRNAITKEAADFLGKLVKAGYNIFISGGTGSGKTTFLNALSDYIPPDERIITVEDSAELQIKNIPNLVRLEARNANVEGENEIRIRDLIKSALRMRPTRIIVGEVRDEAAIDMLTALNTGHDGSLSTGHANSPMDMLSRLESLVLLGQDIPLLAVRKQIASALDIIIHLGRLRDKSRRVLEIVEVLDCIDGEIELNSLFNFVEEGSNMDTEVRGGLKKACNELIHREKLKKAGIEI